MRHQDLSHRPEPLAHGVCLGIATTDEDAEEYPRHVGVNDGGALPEGEAPDRARRIGADALEGEQRFLVRRQHTAVARHRFPCDGLKPAGPDVVAERPPQRVDIVFGRSRERCQRRIGGKPLLVLREDAVHLRLLQHHLRHEYVVRIAGIPPREVPAIGLVPGEQTPPESLAGRRRRQGGGHPHL